MHSLIIDSCPRYSRDRNTGERRSRVHLDNHYPHSKTHHAPRHHAPADALSTDPPNSNATAEIKIRYAPTINPNNGRHPGRPCTRLSRDAFTFNPFSYSHPHN